ncbi:MAG: SMC-Scp complex subunit ScpB [Candidatus Coatesbacteria bacterium]
MSPKAKARAKKGKKKVVARKPKAARKPKPLVLTYSRQEMKRLLEAVLFASDKPVPASILGGILNNSPEEEVKAALAELATEYEEWGRSFVLKEVGGGYLLYSHPAFEPWVKKLFRGRLTLRLSKSALETIAIVAYRQPVTKQEIEVIRGVNADGVLHTLLERKLIRVTGRKEGMGRALLYGSTNEFLQYMGLNDLTELPQIEEMKAILEAQETPNAEGIVEPQGPFASRLPGGAAVTGAAAAAVPGANGSPVSTEPAVSAPAGAGAPETADYAGTEAVAETETPVADAVAEPAATDAADAESVDGASAIAPEAGYDGGVAETPTEAESPAAEAEDDEDEDEDEDDDEDDEEEDEEDEKDD